MKYSYTYFFLVVTSVLLLSSCGNKTDLTKEFSCKSKHQLAVLEEVHDFNKNFTIEVPKHWNTKLYYDNVQSEIFSADTIKSLSESYIMNFSWVNDTIQISKILQAEVHKIKATATRALQMTSAGKCSRCGTMNRPGTRKCQNCGSSL